MSKFEQLRKEYLPIINDKLTSLILNDDLLGESMKYSLDSKAKRIRPLLVIATVLDLGGKINDNILEVAVSLEWLHTYSLIHDDLPAMDNDDLRRGKLTNHKVYGDGVAILAGDALLTDAFYLLSNLNLSDDYKIKLINKLAKAAGSQGMIYGQLMDIKAENKQLNVSEIEKIHNLKTGALLQYSVEAGCILTDFDSENLINYSKHLGLAFQIRDDILDIIGNEEDLGKTIGRDIALDKSTYPSILGLDDSKKMLDQEIQQGIICLEEMDQPMSLLKEILLSLKVGS